MLISSTLAVCPIVGFSPESYESCPSNNCATVLVSHCLGMVGRGLYLFNVQELT